MHIPSMYYCWWTLYDTKQWSRPDVSFSCIMGCYGTEHPWICNLKFFIHCSLSVRMTADAHPHSHHCCMRKCKACDAVCNRREDDLHKKIQCTLIEIRKSIIKWFLDILGRQLCLLIKNCQSLLRNGAVYFSQLRFCAMTSLGLFHLSADGFQADISLCLCVRPPLLSFGRKQRKGCSESYTPAFATTSQVLLKMRSDDTRALGAPLALLLPHSPFLFLHRTHSHWRWCALKGENYYSLARAITLWCRKGREILVTAVKKRHVCFFLCWVTVKSNRWKKSVKS